MPTYEYECNACSCRFEKKQHFHDEAVAECPKCQSKSKRIMVPSQIIFKGSGFYVNDYPKTGGAPKTKESPAKSGEPVKTEAASAQPGGTQKAGDSSTKAGEAAKNKDSSARTGDATKAEGSSAKSGGTPKTEGASNKSAGK